MAMEEDDFDVEEATAKVLKCLETETGKKWLTDHFSAKSSEKPEPPPKSQLRETLETLRDFGLIPQPVSGSAELPGNTMPKEEPTEDPVKEPPKEPKLNLKVTPLGDVKRQKRWL
jgi:hypothetical protein